MAAALGEAAFLRQVIDDAGFPPDEGSRLLEALLEQVGT